MFIGGGGGRLRHVRSCSKVGQKSVMLQYIWHSVGHLSVTILFSDGSLSKDQNGREWEVSRHVPLVSA